VLDVTHGGILVPVRFAALVVVCALALVAGCDNEDRASSSPSEAQRVVTDRPELAFWTNGYAVGLSDDRGQRFQEVIGESPNGTVFPQLFSGVTWSPDGGHIAFAGVAGEQTDEHDEPTDIYSIAPDGTGLEKVTEVGDAGGPLWAPDGASIVFTRTSFPEGGPIRASLWSINLGDSEPTEIAEADDWTTFTAGSFTPDGTRLAVTRTEYDPSSGETSSEIELMDADGSDPTNLIAEASDPAFSPDGGQIAFVSDRDKNGRLCYGDRCSHGNELYIASADGSEVKRLTHTTALNERHPSWLPDGSRLAYQQGEVFANAEVPSILGINPDGSCEQAILAGTGSGTWYANPAWRPSMPREGGGALRC
jgi:Tol biopolymer transport system component